MSSFNLGITTLIWYAMSTIDAFIKVLDGLLSYDLLENALTDAEMLVSSDVSFNIVVNCLTSKCVIKGFKILIKYDYVNNVIRKVSLEVYLSSEITVSEFFKGLGSILGAFKGEFELSKEVVKIIFNIPVDDVGRIFTIIDLLKKALDTDFKLVVNGYEVLLRDEG
jgi:hypothetical protein